MSERNMPNGRAVENTFIVDRVQNATNSAEGPVLPPKQIGPNRVPIVSNLRVLTAIPFIGGTEFTISFDEPPLVSQLDKYNLFYSINGSTDLQIAGTCRRAPARFNINTPNELTVSIIVQTVMQNGFISEIPLSPSCTGKTVAGTVSSADLTGKDIVFGGDSLLTPGLVTYVTAPTIIGTDPVLQFDDSSKNFGNTAGSPTAALTTDRSVAFGVNPTTENADFVVNPDYWFHPVDTSGGNVVATLPSAAGLPGHWMVFKKVTGDTNDLELAADGSDTIDGASTLTITTAYGLASVVRTSATEWSVI